MYGGNGNLGRAAGTCEESVAVRAELNEDERGDEVVDVAAVLRRGFVMNWTAASDCSACQESGGRCGFDESSYRFMCFCRDRPRSRSCGPRKKIRYSIFFFIGGPMATLTSCVIAVYVFIQRKHAKAKQAQEKDIERFMKSNGNLAPVRYKYSSIKKMTNSFNKKLGKGGFGNVYKGQFPDSRLVAVKVLNDSNRNGEDFMNEVASISRTSHVNIVTLLGFCFEGSKRALIYDFMPNGSLEKFIGTNASSSQDSGLGWDKVFEIALGIARGLEYLHQGCNTRILHLDIKPQNILLDKDMNPRISDIGLANLCPNRSSIVSMMGARGTIGYIAPEVCSRNFGEVSYKSDVYSYGMLVLEMAGGKKTIDPRDVDIRCEMYFPNYLYKEVEVNAERAVNEEAESQTLKRNMIIVGLWCIQTKPKDRPSMTRVVEMLEGKLGSLEVPPKPYLYSPPISSVINLSMAKTKTKILLFLLSCNLFLPKIDSKCPKSFSCGNLGLLKFPFTTSSNCGLFLVDGCDSGSPQLRLSHEKFGLEQGEYNFVGNNLSTNELTILDGSRQKSLNDKSCNFFQNLSLSQSPFVSFTFSPNITFFTCWNSTIDPNVQDYIQNHYHYARCQGPPTVYYRNPGQYVPTNSSIPATCLMVKLPTKSNRVTHDLFDELSAEFTLKWDVSQECYDCYGRGGQCVSDNLNKFKCREEGHTRRRKITFIGGVIIASLTLSLIIVFVIIRRKRTKSKQGREGGIELFLKNNGNPAPMRYKYSYIKKMTSSFRENLGKGGFGSVYKGQFPDGRPVAVKVLNELNGDGESFMNEVASISRTSHVNIVALLGFCFEGSKRALIYDFMPNGSLEKFIGDNASSYQESVLGWDKLFGIALGIARGLEYLHQGCNTRILHLDIKPQNILLDEDMNPRISDFGLAKMCPNRSSIVSMIVARGTIGYIAPEVFSRNFGDVSYKSDVYSYGMLVLEMVGGRTTTVDRRDVDCTSEIYFPTYLYKQIEMNAERDGDLAGALDEEDESQHVKRNLIIVGLWCIQTNPKDRPSMTRVVEMLEGKVGSLEVPPKPYLNSAPSAASSYSTSESL
ncbi:LEAF RUST 10 DISEASE-RESISTANCE LOCUS RECEPTOR-LIKE PROTEIN KINASE-like 2.4 [Salvia splendens]|uniref:LEAF RUST 10 DISEASE-RESISTANCE LOCUS RECEPTOR-LIKE PROTEIN KINASE-like 2.4 n=1 Tax=Salvia splendens TaxID=180675 RepID=UPI001C2714C9|nr:LEAF RUST 10 DISEASE-RESISTANCE LOCUS RECEPTOR-LIKE PROTEIN KINASE-like 2.4 [Salvia splendens]